MPHLLITGLIIYSVPKTCHLRTAPFYSKPTHYGETYSYLCDYPQTRYRGTFCTFFYLCIAVLFSCRHTTHRHTIQRDLLSFTFFFYFYLCIALLFTWDTPHTDTETQRHTTHRHTIQRDLLSLMLFTTDTIYRGTFCYLCIALLFTRRHTTHRHRDTNTLYSGTYYHACYYPQTQYIEGLIPIDPYLCSI